MHETLSFLLQDPQKPFIHRDLSWIQFNDRVMAEALSRSNPLFKRLKFLSISSSNLDEFFMIRFASLLRSLSATKIEENKSNLVRIHASVLESVRKFGLRQNRVLELLRKEATRKGVFLHLKSPPGSPAFELGHRIFQEKIFPHLASKNSFQYSAITEQANLHYLVYVNQDLYFELPNSLPPTFWEDQGNDMHGFFLDDLILTHLPQALSLKEKPGILRITRDADFTVDMPPDTESIPDLMRKNLGSRDRGRLVRLQHAGHFPKDFLQEAADTLKLDLRLCFRAPGTLCLHGLFAFVSSLPEAEAREEGLSHPALKSTVPLPFRENTHQLFDSLKNLDFVLHHPYDSFEAYLIWLKNACEDPAVEMIEQTIYRTDSVSRIVDLLKMAAPKKKVRVVLELRARFDEFNNLKVAEDLAQAGAEVKFGFGNLKLHAKVTLVTRREMVDGKEEAELVRYTHLSTGNYNAKTAQQYTDISVLTGNQEIGDDARHFFDSVFKKEVPSSFRHLVTAPIKMHQKIRTLIKAETEAARTGKKAHIIAKVNALVDEKIIEDLYTASQAGVKVDLIVRGACSLVPGIKGLSDNIQVISLIDRFLEHSRIYYFAHSEVIYLSSADWMPRNFFSRLEIAFPILDKRIYRFVAEVLLPGYLKDNVKARRLTSRGKWVKVRGGDHAHRAQWYFEELAAIRYEGTPLFDHPFFQRSSTSSR